MQHRNYQGTHGINMHNPHAQDTSYGMSRTRKVIQKHVVDTGYVAPKLVETGYIQPKLVSPVDSGYVKPNDPLDTGFLESVPHQRMGSGYVKPRLIDPLDPYAKQKVGNPLGADYVGPKILGPGDLGYKAPKAMKRKQVDPLHLGPLDPDVNKGFIKSKLVDPLDPTYIQPKVPLGADYVGPKIPGPGDLGYVAPKLPKRKLIDPRQVSIDAGYVKGVDIGYVKPKLVDPLDEAYVPSKPLAPIDSGYVDPKMPIGAAYVKPKITDPLDPGYVGNKVLGPGDKGYVDPSPFGGSPKGMIIDPINGHGRQGPIGPGISTRDFVAVEDPTVPVSRDVLGEPSWDGLPPRSLDQGIFPEQRMLPSDIPQQRQILPTNDISLTEDILQSRQHMLSRPSKIISPPIDKKIAKKKIVKSDAEKRRYYQRLRGYQG
ncbi:uncharacterized protein [Argopecten irradians]|uniref:uncharacterized protein n=1 Tax=Argopecten irradians TaxID=31199 RepID=UPI003722BAD6